MIVLDANILVRAILGRRVRQLLDTYSANGIRFVTPDVAYADAEKYLPLILQQRGKPAPDALKGLKYLREIIEPVEGELYGEFEAEARERLQDRDEDDWPILATALALGCPIWTEDADFFGTGIAIWTTARVEIFLKSWTNAPESEE
jgi:predicted nucleic acid-binding protein